MPQAYISIVADRLRDQPKSAGVPLCADRGWTEAATVHVELTAPAIGDTAIAVFDGGGSELFRTVTSGGQSAVIPFPSGLPAGYPQIGVVVGDNTQLVNLQTISVEGLARDLAIATARQYGGLITARSTRSYLITLRTREQLRFSLVFARYVPGDDQADASQEEVDRDEEELLPADADTDGHDTPYKRSWLFQLFAPLRFPANWNDNDSLDGWDDTGVEDSLTLRASSSVDLRLEYRGQTVQRSRPLAITPNSAPWHRHQAEIPLRFRSPVAFWGVEPRERLADDITPEMVDAIATLFRLAHYSEISLTCDGVRIRAVVDQFTVETPSTWMESIQAALQRLKALET